MARAGIWFGYRGLAVLGLLTVSACLVDGSIHGEPGSSTSSGASPASGGSVASSGGSFTNPQGGSAVQAGGTGTFGAAGSSSSTGGAGSNPAMGGMSFGGTGAGAGVAGSSSGGASTGGASTAMACGWTPGYTGPLLGRCDAASCTNGQCGIAHGKGGFLTLDDFEGPKVSAAPIAMHWPARDGRVGSWQKFADPSANTSVGLEAAGSGGSPDSKQALHFFGGAGPWGASVALPVGTCYDASAYEGISFWIKGNAAAGNTTLKFNLQTPPTEPTLTGGACTANCSDHFGKLVDVPASWTRVKIPWADLERLNCAPTTPPVPTNFEPQKMVLSLSFQQVDPAKGFDYYIDDVTFDLDDKAANNLGDILTEPVYQEMFKTALPVFSYSGLVSAASSYGQGTFAQTGSALDRKHEVAAFLGQIAHETGSLTIVREAACYPTHTGACTVTDNYYGRGAIQLTYDANYGAADSTFPGIHANPDLVATNTAFAFGTGIWFWMNKGCHGQIMGQSFGGTTNIINGGLECGGSPSNTTGAADRAALYTQFCAALGINARGTLGC